MSLDEKVGIVRVKGDFDYMYNSKTKTLYTTYTKYIKEVKKSFEAQYGKGDNTQYK